MAEKLPLERDVLMKIGASPQTSELQKKAAEIRSEPVSWISYQKVHMLTQEEYGVVTQLDFHSSDAKSREAYLKNNRVLAARVFYQLWDKIAKEQTLQYLLTMLDDLFMEDPGRVNMFREYCKTVRESPWPGFLNLLNRKDKYVVNQTINIIAKIACWGSEKMEKEDLVNHFIFLREQLRVPNNEYQTSVCRALQMFVRVEAYRQDFIEVEGVSILVAILAGKVSFQIQYQLIFCLWCLSFSPAIAETLNKYKVVPTLAEILREAAKEKVQRIILATFRNMLEKPETVETQREHAISMVQAKVLKQLHLLEGGTKFEDEDLTDDIQFLTEKLENSVQDLSSFDEYVTEVKSGRLEWSPVHKEIRFWRENVTKFNDRNYELIRILIHLLNSSSDVLVLCVAAHDVGEYVRHYPRGKHVLEQLGGKEAVMRHLAHDDPNVRYEALLAVQKLMVHNWEYLGKQLKGSEEAVEAVS